ncbi:hypothetical protein QYP01_16135 [Pseudomonas aeruginosa]|nr:hypothetical protein [Pseudomonas aeruginosa]
MSFEEQAGGDERDLQAEGAQGERRITISEESCGTKVILSSGTFTVEEVNSAVQEQRAALAQPSLMPPDRGPWHAVKWDGGRRVDLSSDDFEHDVALTVSGDFVEGDKFRYAQVSDNLPELLSTGQAEQAEAERPEVVAWQYRVTAGPQTGWSLWHPGKGEEFERSYTVERRPLMTVAQHERIVKGWIERWKAYIELSAKIAAQRDAALARVAELESKMADLEKQEPLKLSADVHEFLQEVINSVMGGEDVDMDYEFAGQLGKLLDPVYTAPVAQAQQLHDLDKQCRDDVARALGLRPSQERGFAWSYLLASIKSCVKAAEDTAQAQHSVPEGWKLVPMDPTSQMTFVGQSLRYDAVNSIGEIYRQMLAAAPGKEVGHE